MKNNKDNGNNKIDVDYNWSEQLRESMHNRIWRNKTIIFEDDVKIDEEMSRYLSITKEDFSEYEEYAESHFGKAKVIIEYSICDEYQNDLIRVVLSFYQGYSKETMDLSFFGASLDESMIKYLVNQYRSNLLMKRNRVNIGRLQVMLQEKEDRKN